jgi:hypothetical protein
MRRRLLLEWSGPAFSHGSEGAGHAFTGAVEALGGRHRCARRRRGRCGSRCRRGCGSRCRCGCGSRCACWCTRRRSNRAGRGEDRARQIDGENDRGDPGRGLGDLALTQPLLALGGIRCSLEVARPQAQHFELGLSGADPCSGVFQRLDRISIFGACVGAFRSLPRPTLVQGTHRAPVLTPSRPASTITQIRLLQRAATSNRAGELRCARSECGALQTHVIKCQNASTVKAKTELGARWTGQDCRCW